MWAEVMKLRLEGRRLHRGWWGAQTLFRGRLEVRQRLDPVTYHYSMQAFMRYSEHENVDELGVLFEATLLAIDGELLYLSGFEREPTMQREYRQSWRVRPITYEAAMAAPPPRVVLPPGPEVPIR